MNHFLGCPKIGRDVGYPWGCYFPWVLAKEDTPQAAERIGMIGTPQDAAGLPKHGHSRKPPVKPLHFQLGFRWLVVPHFPR